MTERLSNRVRTGETQQTNKQSNKRKLLLYLDTPIDQYDLMHVIATFIALSVIEWWSYTGETLYKGCVHCNAAIMTCEKPVSIHQKLCTMSLSLVIWNKGYTECGVRVCV